MPQQEAEREAEAARRRTLRAESDPQNPPHYGPRMPPENGDWNVDPLPTPSRSPRQRTTRPSKQTSRLGVENFVITTLEHVTPSQANAKEKGWILR